MIEGINKPEILFNLDQNKKKKWVKSEINFTSVALSIDLHS